MIALNIHRLKAYPREIKSFNALCVCVCVSHWQNWWWGWEGIFRIFFLLGGQKERPGSQRPPIESPLCEEQKSRPHVPPLRAPVHLCALRGELYAGSGRGRARAPCSHWDYTHHMLTPDLGHHRRYPRSHFPAKLLSNFNASEHYIWLKGCVCVGIYASKPVWDARKGKYEGQVLFRHFQVFNGTKKWQNKKKEDYKIL